MPNLTKQDAFKGLAFLRKPFPDHQVGQLPKGTKAQNQCPAAEKRNCSVCGGWHHPKIRHISYVGHAAITDRLLDADPMWFWEPIAYDADGLPLFDKGGGLWIKLTVCGKTMLGYGHARAKGGEDSDPGNREKEVIGDALRNAGMRFGMGLELWHKGDLHAEEEEQQGKFDSESAIKERISEASALLKAQPEKAAYSAKAGLEQTPEELAVWLLAGFDQAKTVEQIEAEKDRVKANWSRIKGVAHIKESVTACAANAMARIREEREPGEEG